MSDYLCPECGGGFRRADVLTDKFGRPEGECCPWCGEGLNGGTDE